MSWLGTIPQFVALASAAGSGFAVSSPDPVGIYLGCAVYLAYSIGSRRLVARHHRAGIRLSGAGDFDAAIHEYELSYRFFSQNARLDNFRSIFLMSASAMSYREMALVNVAFCHSQAGRGLEAKATYERALHEFPESVMATSALKLIQSVESATH